MKINGVKGMSAIYLRMAIASAYLWEVSDRLGFLGKSGRSHVSWGDWHHFMLYASQVMSFLPGYWVQPFAVVASLAEACIGLLLLIGLFTRPAAVGSALLSLCFATAMATSFGIESPLGYSVFTLSAASLLLAGQPVTIGSADYFLRRRKEDIGKTDNMVTKIPLS